MGEGPDGLSGGTGIGFELVEEVEQGFGPGGGAWVGGAAGMRDQALEFIGVCGIENDGMIDDAQETFVIESIAKADGGDGAAFGGEEVDEMFDGFALAGVALGMEEAAAAGDHEALGEERLEESGFALGGEQEEGFAVLALGGEGGLLDGHAAVGSDLFDGHVGEAAEAAGAFGGGAMECANDLGVGPAEAPDGGAAAGGDFGFRGQEGERTRRDEDGAAVFDDGRLMEADHALPVFDFGAGFACREDDGDVEPFQGFDRGAGGFPVVGMVVEQAPVHIGKDHQHESNIAGSSRT